MLTRLILLAGPDLAKGYGEQVLLTACFVGICALWIVGTAAQAAWDFIHGGDER